MTEPLMLEAEDVGVVRLTLNRPARRNALTRELLVDFNNRLARLEGRSDVRLLVLTGAGTVFCAGMDLAQMEETAAASDADALWRQDTDLYRNVLGRMLDFRAPTLAAVNGPAVAGGLGLVLACDLVLAAETATFSLPEPKRGITAAVVTPLLTYRVGVSAASYLLLSGGAMDAQRAEQAGLCHRVAAAGDLGLALEEWMPSILSGAPGALAITKRQLRACAAKPLSAQLDRAAQVSAEARGTPEARDGLRAFLEKRDPPWVATG